jgi:hypothetical protein
MMPSRKIDLNIAIFQKVGDLFSFNPVFFLGFLLGKNLILGHVVLLEATLVLLPFALLTFLPKSGLTFISESNIQLISKFLRLQLLNWALKVSLQGLYCLPRLLLGLNLPAGVFWRLIWGKISGIK